MIKKRSGLIIEYANEERKYVKSTERKKEIMFPKKNHPNQPTTPIPTRRSIRKYKPNPVPKHIIDRIIEAAGAAPSAKNRQPWQYRVYTGNAKKNLLEVMKKGLLREEKEPQLPLSAAGMPDAYNTLHIMENAPVIIMVVNTNGRSPFARAECRRKIYADKRYPLNRGVYTKHAVKGGRIGTWLIMDRQHLFCVPRADGIHADRHGINRCGCTGL